MATISERNSEPPVPRSMDGAGDLPPTPWSGTPGATAAVPPGGEWIPNEQAPRPASGGRIGTAALGMASWMLLGPLPLFFSDDTGPVSWLPTAVWLALTPSLLLVGLWSCSRSPTAASRLLLGATPASLCLLPSQIGLADSYGNLGVWALIIASICFLGFVTAAASDCMRWTVTRKRWTQPLLRFPRPPGTGHGERKETLLVVGVSLACATLLGLAAFRPTSDLLPYWGSNASQGATVTVVWAVLVGTLAVGLVVGRGMRSGGSSLSDRTARRRLVWLILVALSGAGVWLLLGQP